MATPRVEDDDTEAENPEVPEDWYTKEQIAEAVGKTISSVTRWMSDGRLHGERDGRGRWRFSPKEAEGVIAEETRGRNVRKGEYAEIELTTVRELIGLVKEPRTKIDEIQFSIIAGLRVENEKLLAKIETMAAAVEAARDNTNERNMALAVVSSEARIKETAMTRIIEKGALLLSGGKVGGVQLTPAQLEQLVLAGEFLTPEQENMAKAIVTEDRRRNPPKPAVAAATPVNGNGAKSDDPK